MLQGTFWESLQIQFLKWLHKWMKSKKIWDIMFSFLNMVTLPLTWLGKKHILYHPNLLVVGKLPIKPTHFLKNSTVTHTFPWNYHTCWKVAHTVCKTCWRAVHKNNPIVEKLLKLNHNCRNFYSCCKVTNTKFRSVDHYHMQQINIF